MVETNLNKQLKEKAYNSAEKGNYQQAIIYYLELLKIVPHAILYPLGRWYERIGDYKSAMRAYQGQIALIPGDVVAYLMLGKVLMKLKQFKDAIKIYKRAAKLENYSVCCLMGELGETYYQLRKFKKALKCNKRVYLKCTESCANDSGQQKKYHRNEYFRALYTMEETYRKKKKYKKALKVHQKGVQMGEKVYTEKRFLENGNERPNHGYFAVI